MTPGADVLDDHQRAVLDFAARTYRYPGARETDIRDTFGISQVRYEQILNALIDTDAALAYAPVTVKRLRRLREARARARGYVVPK